jgi:hypothetical protein
MLEECCFQFGKSWAPEMMVAHSWEEAESIELTQWIKRFSNQVKKIPPAATMSTAGKSLKEIMFATSNLRHSAVHRLRTSAAGILKMLDTAIAFTQALKDTERTAHIETIRKEVAVVIQDIVQHQTLLERKLSDQLKDFATRRAEIDELERLAIEAMLDNDKAQRCSAGSAIEDLLVGLNRASNSYVSERDSLQEYRKASSKALEGATVGDEGMSQKRRAPWVVEIADSTAT